MKTISLSNKTKIFYDVWNIRLDYLDNNFGFSDLSFHNAVNIITTLKETK